MNTFIVYHTTLQTESETFIRRAVSEFTKRDCSEAVILREETGKPYFSDQSLPCFSLSHSGPYTVCAVGPTTCGVDVQMHLFRGKRRKESELLLIANRFFHKDEADFLKKSDDSNINSLFFDLWTAKESYVKFTGKGVTSFPSFSVTNPQSLFPVQIKKIPFAEETSLFLTAEGEWSVQLYSISD